MNLVSVYRVTNSDHVLFALLQEREARVNISHRRMPTWREHRAFIRSRPYRAWYLLRIAQTYVGSVYLSRQGEVGLFIFRAQRRNGYGAQAIQALMARHGLHRLLANINPRNASARAFLKSLGGVHIQNTYAIEGSR